MISALWTYLLICLLVISCAILSVIAFGVLWLCYLLPRKWVRDFKAMEERWTRERLMLAAGTKTIAELGTLAARMEAAARKADHLGGQGRRG